MSNEPPDVIYLQYYGSDFYVDDIENPEPAWGDEVTWCVDRINKADIEYIHATPIRKSAEDMASILREMTNLLELVEEWAAQDFDLERADHHINYSDTVMRAETILARF